MRAEYARMKLSWGGYSGYDGFVLKDLNNAKLGSIATYTKQVPAFKALLKGENGDLPRFLRQGQGTGRPAQGGARARRLAQLGAVAPAG